MQFHRFFFIVVELIFLGISHSVGATPTGPDSMAGLINDSRNNDSDGNFAFASTPARPLFMNGGLFQYEQSPCTFTLSHVPKLAPIDDNVQTDANPFIRLKKWGLFLLPVIVLSLIVSP